MRSLWQWFFPRLFVNDLWEINLEELKGLGIRGLIVDLDNTLVAWNAYDLEERVLQWVEEAKSQGFAICIVSNALKERVTYFSKLLAIPGISKAQKPRRGAFRAALQELGLSQSEVAVIGDQVFTDVLGGNRLGLYTILVRPISRREFVTTRLGRIVERWILRRFNPHD
ncbi:YqeG family HAD IIIA-type phosphatase [Candidatus Caldatribacterium saccharofermentans]|uniref:YqeG family HAD IIIA-type phosphatase n=1 Tax=Candidatus Caldatribacterium saccharofermentans TaxID=1454753 RepID=A0A7V4TG79_9BACT